MRGPFMPGLHSDKLYLCTHVSMQKFPGQLIPHLQSSAA
jgi:hypothetical protein